MEFKSLPNGIFTEFFQYLNAPDIFYSFDQLNSRFSTLIHHSPLRLACHPLKEAIFNEFLSLQPLSLINLDNNNIEHVLLMFLSLSNLYSFSFTLTNCRTSEIITVLSKSKVRLLSIPNLDFSSISTHQTIPITSLIISDRDLNDLCQFSKCTPMLTISKLNDSIIIIFRNDELIMPTNVIQLKHSIIADECSMTSLLLLEIFREISSISSLTIVKCLLISFLTNQQLCQHI